MSRCFHSLILFSLCCLNIRSCKHRVFFDFKSRASTVEGLNWKWKAPNFLILLSLTVTFDHEFGSDGRFYRARYFSCIWIWNPLIGFSIILLILNELQGRKHQYFILKSAYTCMSSLGLGCDLMYDSDLVFTEILECLTISI